MGFYIGILIKSSPPKGGGTQVDDFTKGFSKGIFPKILDKKWNFNNRGELLTPGSG